MGLFEKIAGMVGVEEPAEKHLYDDGDVTVCYLCHVDGDDCGIDGNGVPFSEKKHHICIMCAGRLRALGNHSPDGFQIDMCGPIQVLYHRDPNTLELPES